jgi:hypothetical protein
MEVFLTEESAAEVPTLPLRHFFSPAFFATFQSGPKFLSEVAC